MPGLRFYVFRMRLRLASLACLETCLSYSSFMFMIIELYSGYDLNLASLKKACDAVVKLRYLLISNEAIYNISH